MIDFPALTHSFFSEVAKGSIEICNEFSLQHEFGIVLRVGLGSELIDAEYKENLFIFVKIHRSQTEISYMSGVYLPFPFPMSEN